MNTRKPGWPTHEGRQRLRTSEQMNDRGNAAGVAATPTHRRGP